MPLQSKWQINIPDVHLASLLFTSPTHSLSSSKRLIVDTQRPDTHYFTPASFRLLCQRFAAGLQKHGLKRGERILLISGNTILYPSIFMGTVMAGCVFSGANPTYVPRELAYQLQDSGATILICAEDCLDKGLQAAEIAGLPLDRVFVLDELVFGGPVKGERTCRSWQELLVQEEEGRMFAWDTLFSPGEAGRTLLALNYSSGTTGLPKGVEITHRNYVANVLQGIHHANLQAGAGGEHSRPIVYLPMYHAMSQRRIIMSLVEQAEVYVMPAYNFQELLKSIQRFKITVLTMVPPVAISLSKDPVVKNYDLSSVRMAGSGAAPLGKEICERIEGEIFDHQIMIQQAWGMTETTCSFLAWDPEKSNPRSTVGEPLANCEAKIMSEDGTIELPRNQRGELWVRGPNVMKGYWKNHEATIATITPDGWLRTGDIAYIDEEGRFFIVDRLKELIKVKGNQVAPAEIEGQLLEHPAVADAAVIGLKVNNGEYPRAYIVLKPAHTATEEEITEFLKDRVAPVKQITGGVIFLDAIPKNPSGKTLRKLLRERAQNELKQEQAASKL
ncbi:putative AMP-binding enzyme [Aspergillus unguis]